MAYIYPFNFLVDLWTSLITKFGICHLNIDLTQFLRFLTLFLALGPISGNLIYKGLLSYYKPLSTVITFFIISLSCLAFTKNSIIFIRCCFFIFKAIINAKINIIFLKSLLKRLIYYNIKWFQKSSKTRGYKHYFSIIYFVIN